MSNNLYIVMPAYNEQDNIKQVVQDWYAVVDKVGNNSRLVVADSGSEDKTHDILVNMCEEYPRLLILENTLKQHGPKLIALYRYAIDNGADWIFQTDSDGQTSPDEFENFWNMRTEYDAILGNRKKRGDGAVRYLVEKVVCLLLWMIFGVKVPDANAPFRLMRASLVQKYIDRFEPNYNIPNIMFSVFYSFYNEKIAFEPISFNARCKGKNSINFVKICKIGFTAIKDFRSFKKLL